MNRHAFKLNKQYLACDRRTDMKKKMRRDVFSKNIWEGTSERQNENIVSGPLINIKKVIFAKVEKKVFIYN